MACEVPQARLDLWRASGPHRRTLWAGRRGASSPPASAAGPHCLRGWRNQHRTHPARRHIYLRTCRHCDCGSGDDEWTCCRRRRAEPRRTGTGPSPRGRWTPDSAPRYVPHIASKAAAGPALYPRDGEDHHHHIARVAHRRDNAAAAAAAADGDEWCCCCWCRCCPTHGGGSLRTVRRPSSGTPRFGRNRSSPAAAAAAAAGPATAVHEPEDCDRKVAQTGAAPASPADWRCRAGACLCGLPLYWLARQALLVPHSLQHRYPSATGLPPTM
eukprot:scaffold3210_cov402-Prasinococcus_capsulatus_cf.AAC.9